MKAARKKRDRELLRSSSRRLPELRASSTRSSTTSRTSTSSRTTTRTRASVYLDLIKKRPQIEVHPERVPRVRRALLQRGAGRSRASGISPRRRTSEVIEVPAADEQGLRLRLVQARVRLLEPGRLHAARSTRSRRRSTSAPRTRSSPGATKLADSARHDIDPGLRAQGRPGRGVQLLPQHLGRRRRARTRRRSR